METAADVNEADMTGQDATGVDPTDAGYGPVENIDWGLAATVGKRVARPGPRVTRYTSPTESAALSVSPRHEGV